MAFVKKTWLNRAAQNLSRRVLSIISSTDAQIIADVSRGDENVTEAGTPLNAENLNDLENRIANAIVPMVGATSSQEGAEGLVPAPTANDRLHFLRGDGTWQEVESGGGGGETYVLPTASSNVKGGIKVGDGLSIRNEVLSAPVMLPPTVDDEFGQQPGYRGLVPDPAYSDRNKFLRGDGTWANPIGTLYISLPKTATTQTEIAAGSNGTLSVALDTVTGFTPVGIVEYQLSGTGASSCTVYRTSIENNTAYVGVRNWHATKGFTPSCTVSVLYLKG